MTNSETKISNQTLEKAKKFVIAVAPYLVIIFAIYLLTSIQLSAGNKNMIVDIDTMFHYNRFYDAAQQIKTHNFSYFQMNYGFNHSGRIINALYGPVVAYLNGLLILIAGTWFRYQILTYWVIGLVGGIGMYQLSRKAKANKIASTVVAVLFLNIGAVQAWFDHSNMIAWGAILLPYALIEGVNMVQDHDHPIRWIRLMLIMSLIAQTHVISTALATIGLIPFFFYGLSKAKNKSKMALHLIFAILGTVALTANVWGALLTIYTTNNIAPTLPHSLVRNAVEVGAGTIRGKILSTLAITFFFQFCYAIFSRILFEREKEEQNTNTLNILTSVEGFIFLAIASKYFPWKAIQTHLPALKNFLQFPHRLLIIAYPLLLLGLAITITQLMARKETATLGKAALVLTLFVTMQNYGSNYSRIDNHANNLSGVFTVKNGKETEYEKNKGLPKTQYMITYDHGLKGNQKIYGADANKHGKLYIRAAGRGVYYKNTTDMSALGWATHTKEGKYKLFDLVEKINPDYLPIKQKSKKKITAQVADSSYIKHVVKPSQSGKYKYQVQGSDLVLTWKGKKKGYKYLPVVMYKQSKLTVNGKKVKHPLKHSKAKVKIPRVKQKQGINTAVLQFKVPTSFAVELFVALASWIVLMCYGIYYWSTKKKEGIEA